MTTVPVWPRVRLVARTIEAALDARAQLAELRRSIRDALGPLDDAVTQAACVPRDAAEADRVHAARQALHRLAAQIHGHGGRDG
jgi:hypothetical protein